MSSLIDVVISTYVNPHLFWVVNVNSAERVKFLSNLNNYIKEWCTSHKSDGNNNFEVEEVVCVQWKNKYCRAIIRDIYVDNGPHNVLCWLVDYGTLIETDVVYKLPMQFRKSPPLALQASLNNVAYVEQQITFNPYGEAVKVSKAISTPTNVAYQASMKILANRKSVKFKFENKCDGIEFGDILYEQENMTLSLRQSLIDKEVLVVDEEIFSKIKENIADCKDDHLPLISNICKHYQCLQDGDLYIGCNVISKYLEEFENCDLLEEEGPLSNRCRSRNSTNSAECIENSTNVSMFDSNTPREINKYGVNTETDDEASAGNTSLVQDTRVVDQTTGDRSDEREELNAKENIISRNNKKKVSPSKEDIVKRLKQRKSQISSNNKEDSFIVVEKDLDSPATKFVPTTSEDLQPVKRQLPTNIILMPGGATRTVNCVNKIRKLRKSISPERCNEPKTEKINKPLKSDNVLSDKSSTSEDSASICSPVTENVYRLKVKPHCSCKQCDHWTNETSWGKNLEFQDDHKLVKTVLPVEACSLFKKDSQNSDDKTTIISIDFASVSNVQKQTLPKILVHSESIPSPVQLVSRVNFHQDIHKSLSQLEYKQTKRIQIYSWPALFRHQHVCMISGPQTGKTMAYLPVMCTFILEKAERYEPLLKARGPIVIILCSNSKKCEDIYDLSKILLANNKSKVFLATYPMARSHTTHIDLLISTPVVLVDLLKSKTINFKRLCHLILEDSEKILSRESEIMNKVFDLIQSMLNNRICSKPVQVVVCAEHWTSKIEKLLKNLNKTPLVCIGNALEAALYGKMKFSMQFLNSAFKEQELNYLLKDQHKICKTVLVCKNEEIEVVQTILMLKGIEFTVITEDLNKEDILYLENVWTQSKGGQYTVLVCTDFLLNTILSITSATLLIHYTLPTSWSKFVKRFSCLLENCRSPLDTQEVKMLCQSVVFIDETCEDQILKMFNFINATELKNQLSGKLKKYFESLKHAEEQKKINNQIGLCDSLKLFGACTTVSCPKRHILAENLDVSDSLPKSGRIKFKIVNIQDVTLYSIQLISHIDSVENKIREFDHVVDVIEDLTNTLKINKEAVLKPVVGVLYAFCDSDNSDRTYCRCELLEVENECVKVKLIDKGTIINTIKTRLYELPKEFSDLNMPRKIIDAYLANYIPPYCDENFSSKAFYTLKTMLEKYDYKNIILTADVHLQLGHTLWLKNVYQEVELLDKTIPGFQMIQGLLKFKLLEYNDSQLVHLYKLCNEAAITLPSYEQQDAKIVKEEIYIKPQWAYLDAEEVNEVFLSAAVSPDEVYVRLNKFNHLLYKLQKEMQESLKTPHYPKLQDIKVGNICLAYDSETREYARALIQKIENEKVLCFFVDFGDEQVVSMSELKHIHNKFILKLPFQSIQCRLVGIEPVLKEWQNNVTDILYEYSTEPQTDIFRSLFIKVCNKEENCLIPEQSKFSVLLKDGFGERNMLINKLLIDCGLALPNSEILTDFDIPKISTDQSDDSDQETENILNILQKTKEVEENSPSRATTSMAGMEDPEIFICNPLQFLEELMAMRNIEHNPRAPRELPAIQAAPLGDCLNPDVWWHQTTDLVVLNIRLTDVTDYYVNLLKERILHFKTVKDDKKYALKCILYEKVDAVQHASLGPQIRIKLTKVKKIDWPRLTLLNQRLRNVHYDISAITIKEEKQKRLKLPKDLDVETESDDERIDMMYHFVSDLESDLDADVAHDSD